VVTVKGWSDCCLTTLAHLAQQNQSYSNCCHQLPKASQPLLLLLQVKNTAAEVLS